MTNKAIVIISAFTLLLVFFLDLTAGYSWHQSLLQGIGAGFATFLAWAFSRELDPDHDYSAFVSTAFSLVAVIF